MEKKVPYFVKIAGEQLFFLPALYFVIQLPDTETGEMIKRYTCTMITRAANSVMAMIHNDGDNAGRMPLFLPFELSKKWLNEDLSEEDYKAILNYEIPSEELEHYPVYTIRSSKERPDGKPKNEYYEWEKLPDLGEMSP